MTADTEAMRASRSILAAERSGQLRPYPTGAHIPADTQQLRDETQQSLASRNGPLRVETRPSTISSGESDERAAFEAWGNTHSYLMSSDYAYQAWRAWQARAALATQPAESKACASVGVEPVRVALSELCALEADGMQASESAIEVWERARAALASPAPSVREPDDSYDPEIPVTRSLLIAAVHELARYALPAGADDQVIANLSACCGIATPPAATACDICGFPTNGEKRHSHCSNVD